MLQNVAVGGPDPESGAFRTSPTSRGTCILPPLGTAIKPSLEASLSGRARRPWEAPPVLPSLLGFPSAIKAVGYRAEAASLVRLRQVMLGQGDALRPTFAFSREQEQSAVVVLHLRFSTSLMPGDEQAGPSLVHGRNLHGTQLRGSAYSVTCWPSQPGPVARSARRAASSR